jgi:hypothetical protein
MSLEFWTMENSLEGFLIIFRFYFSDNSIQKERSLPTDATRNEVIFSGLPKNHSSKVSFE